MFKSFKKHFQKEKPEFNSLKVFQYKDKYFHRVATWDWLNKAQIHIFDPHGTRLITLDEWPQLVFLDAKGKLTVSEYIDYVASKYPSKIPRELDETIIYQLNTLAEEKLIEYSDTEVKLEAKFENPISDYSKT